MVVRAGTDQEETESSELKKNRILRFWYHENLVTISCFHTFLIFIQSYIFDFCIYLKSLLASIDFWQLLMYDPQQRR